MAAETPHIRQLTESNACRSRVGVLIFQNVPTPVHHAWKSTTFIVTVMPKSPTAYKNYVALYISLSSTCLSVRSAAPITDRTQYMRWTYVFVDCETVQDITKLLDLPGAGSAQDIETPLAWLEYALPMRLEFMAPNVW